MAELNVYQLWDQCKEKPCRRCKQIKPASEYYVRSGIENPTEYGHYVSECKACMLERGKGQKRMPRGRSRVESENVAIDYLATKGIVAMPGKACTMPDTDICAFACVGIEVKLGIATHHGRQDQWMFGTSPKQQKRGFLAHLVMMIVPREIGNTYYLFPASHPVFYKDGKIKHGWTYVEGRQEVRHGDQYVVLTEGMMQDAQDAVHLIWNTMKRITMQIKTGKSLVELMPCVNQPDWDLVGYMPEFYNSETPNSIKRREKEEASKREFAEIVELLGFGKP